MNKLQPQIEVSRRLLKQRDKGGVITDGCRNVSTQPQKEQRVSEAVDERAHTWNKSRSGLSQFR